MSYHLTVVSPFQFNGRNLKKGDHVTDAKEVAEVLAGPMAHQVVKRFPLPEHVNGDFYRTPAELRERAEKVFKTPVASK